MPKAHTSVFMVGCSMFIEPSMNSRAIHLNDPGLFPESEEVVFMTREMPKSQIIGWPDAETKTFAWFVIINIITKIWSGCSSQALTAFMSPCIMYWSWRYVNPSAIPRTYVTTVRCSRYEMCITLDLPAGQCRGLGWLVYICRIFRSPSTLI